MLSITLLIQTMIAVGVRPINQEKILDYYIEQTAHRNNELKQFLRQYLGADKVSTLDALCQSLYIPNDMLKMLYDGYVAYHATNLMINFHLNMETTINTLIILGEHGKADELSFLHKYINDVFEWSYLGGFDNTLIKNHLYLVACRILQYYRLIPLRTTTNTSTAIASVLIACTQKDIGTIHVLQLKQRQELKIIADDISDQKRLVEALQENLKNYE